MDDASEPDGVLVGQLIELRPSDDLPEGTLTRRPRDYGSYCQHARIELATDVQRAYCKACEKEVPLFDALCRFADEYERWVRGYNEARRACKLKREELAEVERKLRNAKARYRRLERQGMS